MKRLLVILILAFGIGAGSFVYFYGRSGVVGGNLVVALLSPSPSPAATPRDTNGITQQLEQVVSSYVGTYGVYVRDLNNGTEYWLGADGVFPAASQMKLPIFLAAYLASESGQLNLDENYVLQESDKVDWSTLGMQPTGSQWTYRQMLQFMGSSSDNTAAGILIGKLGLPAVDNALTLAGMTHSSFDDDQTTPRDVGEFFYRLYDDKLLQPQDKDELLTFLTNTAFENMIPVGLPTGVRVSHKVGIEDGAFSDGGIIYGDTSFILVIMSHDADPDEAPKAMAAVAKVVWEYEEARD